MQKAAANVKFNQLYWLKVSNLVFLDVTMET